MDIEEVRLLKRKLETDITTLVNSFQHSTMLTVTRFEIEHYCTDEDLAPISTNIKIKTELAP